MNKKLIKKLIICMIVIFIISLMSGCIETMNNGKHNGQITAIEKEGLIWKTYTVYVKSDISSSQEDNYCLEDLSLIPKIEQSSKDRSKVTVLYRDEFIVAPWRCGSYNGGIITGIEQ